MPLHFVHRYDVVRVKVAVEAADHASAIRAADAYLALNSPIHPRASNMEGDQYLCPKWLSVESADEVTGYLVDEAGDPEYAKSVSYDASGHPTFSAWEDQDDFPAEDWRLEVANHETRLGYEAWVSAKREERGAPEIITGLGQYKAGKGGIVSDWHDSQETAVAEYHALVAAAGSAPISEETN